LTNRTQRVVIDGCYSDWLPVSSGVPQGSILGPFFFIIFINDLPDVVSSSEIALYADDSKLFKVIKSQDDRHGLQADLQRVSLWADEWKMVFNVDKCKTLSISRKKLTADVTYTMKGTVLDNVKTVKDLGITVSDDLNWRLHISNITSKANKVLGLIKRVCKDLKDPDSRKTL
jgi:hypothetical protein